MKAEICCTRIYVLQSLLGRLFVILDGQRSLHNVSGACLLKACSSYLTGEDDDDDFFKRFAVNNDSDEEAEIALPINSGQPDDPKPMCIGMLSPSTHRHSTTYQADLSLVLYRPPW